MSEENLAVVQAMAKAFNEGDYERALGFLSPDIEYHELSGMPGAGEGVGVYRGHDELTRWYTEFLGEWEEGFQSTYEEITDLDDRHVMTVENWRGRGTRSGITVEMTAVGLHTVLNGEITCMRYFRTEAEAIAAAELSE
jgi:ketosteroid isomerase-like protein